MKKYADPLSGNVSITFANYTVPSIVGMCAVLSANIVDALFLGNYVGPDALGAVTLSTPIGAIIFGIGFMITAGGVFLSSSALGKNKRSEASTAYSSSILLLLFVTAALCSLCYWKVDSIVEMLGAKDGLVEHTRNYLEWMFVFSPAILLAYSMCIFCRVNAKPRLSAFAMLAGATFNVIFDYILIVHFEAGAAGAAISTGISYSLAALIIVIHSCLERGPIQFNFAFPNVRLLLSILKYGNSEFISELSIAIVALAYNHSIIALYGSAWIPAFSIFEYAFLVFALITRGICEALQPLNAINYGASNPKRIIAFTLHAVITASAIAILVSLSTYHFPETIVHLFVSTENADLIANSAGILKNCWFIYLFFGINAVIVSFFISVGKPVFATAISLGKSLFLPLVLISIVLFLDIKEHLFYVFPLSELIMTAFIVLMFLMAKKGRYSNFLGYWQSV